MRRNISSEELRLGNNINFLGKPCIITSISKGLESDLVGTKEGGILPISAYNPILLTEEWLFKLGFTKEFGGYKLNIFRIGWGDGDFLNELYTLIYSNKFFKKVQYVHEIQNLYFALTGEELKLKN